MNEGLLFFAGILALAFAVGPLMVAAYLDFREKEENDRSLLGPSEHAPAEAETGDQDVR